MAGPHICPWWRLETFRSTVKKHCFRQFHSGCSEDCHPCQKAEKLRIEGQQPPQFSISGHISLDQLEMGSCLSQVGLPIAPPLMRWWALHCHHCKCTHCYPLLLPILSHRPLAFSLSSVGPMGLSLLVWVRSREGGWTRGVFGLLKEEKFWVHGWMLFLCFFFLPFSSFLFPWCQSGALHEIWKLMKLTFHTNLVFTKPLHVFI